MASHKSIDAKMNSAPGRITNESELKSVRRLENSFTNSENKHRIKAYVYGTVAAISGTAGAINLSTQPPGPHSNVGSVSELALALLVAGLAGANLDKRDRYGSFARELRGRIRDYHDRRYNGQR